MCYYYAIDNQKKQRKSCIDYESIIHFHFYQSAFLLLFLPLSSTFYFAQLELLEWMKRVLNVLYSYELCMFGHSFSYLIMRFSSDAKRTNPILRIDATNNTVNYDASIDV